MAVASVCALDSRSTQRPVLLLVLATALLSQLEFPFLYDRVATGSWSGVVVPAVRNGMLLCATIWSIVQLCCNGPDHPAAPLGRVAVGYRFGNFSGQPALPAASEFCHSDRHRPSSGPYMYAR
ncbi:hypothetical protein [Nocardia sp. NPDC052112]|uniref:hypothetical protein n=1 Tax=Nocardia sp. NPDC052112 TaxID=3155646 RepID=UPI003443FCE7